MAFDFIPYKLKEGEDIDDIQYWHSGVLYNDDDLFRYEDTVFKVYFSKYDSMGDKLFFGYISEEQILYYSNPHMIKPQSKKDSHIEVSANAVIGILLGLIVMYLLHPWTKDLPPETASPITVGVMFMVSYIRGYGLRRYFNKGCCS